MAGTILLQHLQSTPTSIVERSGLQDYEWNVLFDGRSVEPDDPLPLYPGAHIEIELSVEASSEDALQNNQTDRESPDLDVSSLGQVHSFSDQQCKVIKASIKQQPIREVKPNPAIAPDPDGFIPFRQRTSDGHRIVGRTLVPPNWARNRMYRAAAESGLFSVTMQMN